MKNTVGIILARFQPIHNGHLSIIRKAYKENEFVYIFIGSSDTRNARNPIAFQTRYTLLVSALKEEGLTTNVKIVPLPDLYGEHNDSNTWGFYLYANIVRVIKQDSFNFYYGDGISKVSTWFPDFILKNFVHLKLVEREDIPISSTMIRELILNDGNLEGLVPSIVIENRELLRQTFNYV